MSSRLGSMGSGGGGMFWLSSWACCCVVAGVGNGFWEIGGIAEDALDEITVR